MKKLMLLGCLAAFSSQAQKTMLHCGQIYHPQNGKWASKQTIVVEKNRIIAIESGFSRPGSGDQVVDLSNQTVLPGLIDMHVHIESETSKDQYIKRMSQTAADIAFEAQKHAMTTLMAGFTTVRDLGGTGVNISLRNAINKGLVAGPRIFTSGKTIATTGGHGDPSNGWRPDIKFPDGTDDGVVNSAEEGRRAVRQRYQDGVDQIKITATGGVLSIAKSGKGPQFTASELDGVIQTANDYGYHVAAHAHGAEGMKRALRAGVRTIEHGTFLDDEAIALFKANKAYLVPTIIAGKTVADSAKIKGYYHPMIVPKAIETGALIQEAFAKAYKAGVSIAFGTDAGVFPHGYNAKEFQYMHEAGMPMEEALKIATRVNASILGMDQEIGSLEVGKLADIIAVTGNPVQDPKVLMKTTFVMKDGQVYKKP